MVPCHKLVLGSVSSTLRAALAARPDMEPQPVTVIMPEFRMGEVSLKQPVSLGYQAPTNKNVDASV